LSSSYFGRSLEWHLRSNLSFDISAFNHPDSTTY
jgi:hypothetical protein